MTVKGAATEPDAVAAARTVARDSLVKTAFFGSDPNWGRIVMALGNAPAHRCRQDRRDAERRLVCRAGTRAADRESADLSGRDIEVLIDLHAGDAHRDGLTNDLSHAYVEENSAYSS